MFRVYISYGLNLIVTRSFRGLGERTRGARSHRAIMQATLMQDLAFADSGFWDFALLSLYDYGVRKVVLGGITAMSEFGWTERALIGSSRALDFTPSSTPFGTLKNLASVFWHLGLNFALALAGAFSLQIACESDLNPVGHAGPTFVAFLDLWAVLVGAV